MKRQQLLIRGLAVLTMTVSGLVMARPAHAEDDFGCYESSQSGCFCVETSCTQGGIEYRYYCECKT